MISFEIFHQTVDQIQEDIILYACFRQYCVYLSTESADFQFFSGSCLYGCLVFSNMILENDRVCGRSCELRLWKAMRYIEKTRMRTEKKVLLQ